MSRKRLSDGRAEYRYLAQRARNWMYEAFADVGMMCILAIYPERQNIRFSRPDRRRGFRRAMARELALSTASLTAGSVIMLFLREYWQSLCTVSVAGVSLGAPALLTAYFIVSRVCGRITDIKTATFDRSRHRFSIPAGLGGGAILTASILFALVWLPPVVAVGPFAAFVVAAVVSGMLRRHW